ncbi:Holliday junction branch migration DNA helicase RuvB [Candidatus Wolfebacteria bacterium]|nr:Holliday junction branch migration DNA helicase RuvB [Candidatus Wolfebacteria bacterium]
MRRNSQEENKEENKFKDKSADKSIDLMLRPSSWGEYIGQKKIKSGLKIIIEAAGKREEAIDHLLFYGQPGLGKTTLAILVAKETRGNFKMVSAPNLSKSGDLIALLSNLEERDVLFIDEAHRLHPAVEEVFYSAIDNRKINFMVGKGPASRMLSLDLPSFTLIAATTRVNLVSAPLRSRFGAIFQIDYYENNDIEAIIERSAEILGVKIDKDATRMIVRASRFTPRLANRILKRARDIAEVKNSKIITKIIDRQVVLGTFDLLGIDELGLEIHDRKLLETIIKKFRGGPVGISALAAALGEERGAIEEVYEPYLMKINFLQRTPGGRTATIEARDWLDAALYKINPSLYN